MSQTKKPTLTKKNKLLEGNLKKSIEKIIFLESELRKKDLTIKALTNDLRKHVEKIETEPTLLAQKRSNQSKYDDYHFTVKRPCEHWGELKY